MSISLSVYRSIYPAIHHASLSLSLARCRPVAPRCAGGVDADRAQLRGRRLLRGRLINTYNNNTHNNNAHNINTNDNNNNNTNAY